jgi:NAD(P)-dependent dehydrogenase (short-subunit alcohol dehydrogenase family)
MADFTGKVVLVTGAGKGTGRAIAQAFAAHGASLAINDLTPVNLDQTEAGIRAAGGRVKAYIVDVTKKMPIQGLVNTVMDDWGRIDILVNCAQVKPPSTLLDMDDWDWQRTLDVNLTGVFLLMQSVGRVMRAQGGGSMLTIAPHSHTEPEQAAYSISKAGLVELSARARREFSEYGIQVHLINPDEANDIVRLALSLCE